jgi:hypothetical protein
VNVEVSTKSPLIFNVALERFITRVQANQDDLKLDGTHEFAVYADVNALGGSTRTIKKNRILLVLSKQIGLEVNVETTEYLVMPRNQNVGQNSNAEVDNKHFQRGRTFEKFGTTITN